ncbi:Tuftelin [Merluccius polli]|uniref:Tuftelin n=1 Tax=Merluccius polli TaxID=89951 RepID=A0AA47MWB7_MERPO|nr:Tuftelin [Merluccius polli]
MSTTEFGISAWQLDLLSRYFTAVRRGAVETLHKCSCLSSDFLDMFPESTEVAPIPSNNGLYCGVLISFTSSLGSLQDGCRRLRLTLLDQSPSVRSNERPRGKPIGRAFALVQPAYDRTSEPIKPVDEKVEVIKVYLEARKEEQQRHEESLKMLSEEVSQIQEVRYCLKNLREQMATKHKEADEAERDNMREVSRRLYAQLQDAEKKHQEERERLQTEGSDLRQRLGEQTDRLKEAEEDRERKDMDIEDLQRLLRGMEQETTSLRESMHGREEELQELRRMREEGQKDGRRAEQLEKEVAILKEKIHHLDDMLKSQQRKVRHMIEQLQNSRMLIQERERVIKELEEKVAFLEAENREMHDQMEYFLGDQRSNAYLSTERNPRIVYSKTIKPSTSSSKPLPFIKIIEIKS